MSQTPDLPDELPVFDPFPPDLTDALGVLRAVAGHCMVLASYEIRPYSMRLDRRVWRWQIKAPGWSQLTTAETRALATRLRRGLPGDVTGIHSDTCSGWTDPGSCDCDGPW